MFAFVARFAAPFFHLNLFSATFTLLVHADVLREVGLFIEVPQAGVLRNIER